MSRRDVSKQNSSHSVQTIAVVLLLFLFTLTSLALIALGASIYRRNVRTFSENSETRTAFGYLTQKVRQADKEGGVLLASSTDAFIPSIHTGVLVFPEEVNGDVYHTVLYVYDGFLREVTMRAGTTLSPDAGQKLFPAELMTFKSDYANPSFLTVELSYGQGEERRTETLFLTLRVTEGVHE